MTRIAGCCRFICWSTLLLAANARAQLEGTLFTEPEERAYLDYLREEFLRNNAADDFNIEEADIPEIPDAVVVAEEAAGPVEYSFGGTMSRRDGVRIWLNGNLLAEAELPDGFSLIESGSNIALRIVQGERSFVLLPGQTVDVTSGTIIENFQRPAPAAETTFAPVATAATEEPTVATEAVAPEASQPVEDATTSVAAATIPVQASEADASTDPITAAVDALDDEAVDTLLEVLESRRLARTQPEDTTDEAPDNQAP